jgi:hypothetical protein
MDDAGFVLGSWIITVVSVAAYAVWVVRRGRKLAEHATSEDMPWT